MLLSHPRSNPISIALRSLSAGRAGITSAFGQSLAEAASVCLDEQGHTSPTDMKVAGNYQLTAQVDWDTPTAQARRCWNDDEYTTEHGAYGIAALLVEHCGMEIVQRSKKKTGFDFWLGNPNTSITLFQGLSRLEVSGIRHGDIATVDSRVRQKLKQTKASDGSLPAVVIVVEFGHPKAKVVERCTK